MNPITIGIVGGAGPMAGALLTKKIVQTCQKVYGCVDDADFPRIILLSFPFSEMLQPDTPLQKESKVEEELKCALSFLVKGGADLIGIACNTLHGFLRVNSYQNKIVNLIGETKTFVAEKKVLVLCTKTSVQKNVHNFPGKVLPSDSEQVFIDTMINKVLTGSIEIEDSNRIKACIETIIEREPEISAVLLGCTELSVLFDEFPIYISEVEILDPLDALTAKLCTSIKQQGVLL